MLFPVLNISYLYISTFRSTRAIPKIAVFCSSWISWFPVALLRYFLNDFKMVPVASIITGITFVYVSHALCFYCKVFIFYILESSRFLSLSHFCLLKLQHLLAYMLLFYHFYYDYYYYYYCARLIGHVIANEHCTFAIVCFWFFFWVQASAIWGGECWHRRTPLSARTANLTTGVGRRVVPFCPYTTALAGGSSRFYATRQMSCVYMFNAFL